MAAEMDDTQQVACATVASFQGVAAGLTAKVSLLAVGLSQKASMARAISLDLSYLTWLHGRLVADTS